MTLEIRFRKNTLVVVGGIIKQIDQHPNDTRTTSQYAKEAGMNRKRFQAAFKHLTGTGVQEYKNGLRMQIACQLLTEAEKPIKEIASICLFKSQRAFTTAFKKAFGMTPVEYQNKNS